MSRAIRIIFLGLLLGTLLFSGDSVAYDTNNPNDPMGVTSSSDDDESTIESGDSSTGDERRIEEIKGTIVFNPQQYEGMEDKGVGQNQSIVIQDFSDNREKGLNKHVGTLYQFMYHFAVKKLHNTEPIDLALKNAMVSLFSANGFSVNEKDTMGDPIILKGKINTIWVRLHHSVYAEVDIDIQVVDSKDSKILWSGKISKKKEIATEKTAAHAAFLGIMGDGTELEPFLNLVLAEAVVEAWNNGGLKDALKSIADRRAKGQHKEQSLKQVVQTEPGPSDAKANFKVGIGHYELDQFNEAIKSFKQAIALKPGWARAHYRLGRAYLKVNDKESAVEQYETLQGLDKNYAKKLFDIIYKDD